MTCLSPSRADREQLATGLEELVVAGLMFRRGFSPDADPTSSMPWCRRPRIKVSSRRDASY